MAQEPTDQELVIRLKSGDVTALSALDQRYRVRIIQLIAQLAKSDEEAEDIYQEAILKAVTHIASFDHRRSFYNWLHRIAKNRCIDEYRRRGQTEITEGNEILLKLPTTERSPLDEVLDSELQEKIQKAIDILPERQQSVVKLRLLEGLNYKEIARRIGGSVHAVKSLFSVARKTLKTQLQFYLGCLASLRPGTNGMETPTSTTMGISGFISLAVHLIISVALFYSATDGMDTKERGRSKETSIALITGSADSRVSLRRIKRHRHKQAVWEPHTFETKLSQKHETDRMTRKSLPHYSLIILNRYATLPSFSPDETGLEFHESVSLTGHLISSERTFVATISKRSYRRLDQVTTNLSDLQVNRLGSISDLADDFRRFSRPAQKDFSPTQAKPSAISNALRRLRAFRKVQNLEAYSLAQLRRIARRLGQYPLLISQCREQDLRALLANGWTPIVILRSPVGGKHLWTIADWDADTEKITLINPLEKREMQLDETAFMQGWRRSNAPATCLLLSTQPLPNPFLIPPIRQNQSMTFVDNGPRVWY